MATDLIHHHIATPGVKLHVVTAGSGPAVVLLHGWPQTWFEWRDVIPTLAETHTVVAPDLRGLGDSERPASGYDKQTIAEDIRSLLHELGHSRYAVVGHDWGGIVAYFLAAAHPAEVSRLAVLEVMLPTDFKALPLIMPGVNPGWHFAFHNVPGVPELLLKGKEDAYLHGQDIAHAEELARKKLTLPVLALGGAHSFGPMVERSLARAVETVRGEVLADCGHWMTEEKPKEVSDALRAFLTP